jgi:hypothetical protein
MSKILLIKIHGACSRLNVFWRCFEWRRNADHLRNRQRLRFKLIAYPDKRAKENGPSDQEVRQQRHSHRPISQWLGTPNMDRGRRAICAADHTRDEIRDGCVAKNDVRYWHKADNLETPINVRFRG